MPANLAARMSPGREGVVLQCGLRLAVWDSPDSVGFAWAGLVSDADVGFLVDAAVGLISTP